MIKNYKNLMILSLLLLAGCGGGGGDNSTLPSRNTAISSGTYLDSAVKGINYCIDGKKAGVTDRNGMFRYTLYKSVEFRLGSCEINKGLVLRTLEASDLNASVFTVIIETNTNVASLLQSLDADGNASNGIEIVDELNTIVQNAYESDKNLSSIGISEDMNVSVDIVKSKLIGKDLNLSYVNQTAALNHVLNTINEVDNDTAKAQALKDISQIAKDNNDTILKSNLTKMLKDINTSTANKDLKEAMIYIALDLNLTAADDNLSQTVQTLIDNRGKENSVVSKYDKGSTYSPFYDTSGIDIEMQKIDGLYFPWFAGYTLPGVWVQYEYDANGQPKTDTMGINYRYEFGADESIAMNISIVDQWIPLGKYEISSDGRIISFQEGSASAKKKFEFIQHMDGPCVMVNKYDINGTQKTLDKKYQLCKEL